VLLKDCKINRITGSFVKQDWIVAYAELSNDIREALPYLNAVIEQAVYNPALPSLTFHRSGKYIIIAPTEIKITQTTTKEEAQASLDELTGYINEVWAKREAIVPVYERRELNEVKARDILKFLPRTNCRECGLPTCFAFAMALINRQKKLRDCPPLSSPEFAEKMQALVDLLRTGGLEDTTS
jgi:ArsR family metal-binding transcriptional regulator